MTAIETAALIIWGIFYASFFTKMILMRRQGINSNLLGIGEKPEKTRTVEQMLKVVTFSGAPIQLASVFFSGRIWGLPNSWALQGFGLLLAAVGTAFFIAAMHAMKMNWRSGCDINQNTSLTVSGPYKISRNPAFVGFDLLYIGWALAFPNIINLVASSCAIVIFHMQILEEEKFLETVFGKEYQQYKTRVNRYLGKMASTE